MNNVLSWSDALAYFGNELDEHLGDAPSRTVTTGTGLEALKNAGWKLCVLDFGKGPTRRGQELLAFLNRMS